MSQRKPRRKSRKKQTKQEQALVIETHMKQLIPILFRSLTDASGYCYDPAGKTPKILIKESATS